DSANRSSLTSARRYREYRSRSGPGRRKARREFVDGHGREPPPGIERRRRKARLVWGIREMLRLEADGAADGIGLAALADVVWRLAGEEGPGVELHARLRRVHLHDPPRNRV